MGQDVYCGDSVDSAIVRLGVYMLHKVVKSQLDQIQQDNFKLIILYNVRMMLYIQLGK